jgi:RimJ/RimL family protein N-acetyltransferase
MADSFAIPIELRTARLYMRPWRAGDAPGLHSVLAANRAHLEPWIPPRVADPATIPRVAERLAGFAADFVAGREWRYALFAPDEKTILGEVGLYPRDATGRVELARSDRVELGYWLCANCTGKGVATEATRLALGIAALQPRFAHAEIRCDARNAPSAAIPQRLSFSLASTIREITAASDGVYHELQLWIHPLGGG